jgi:hypothetical protein
MASVRNRTVSLPTKSQYEIKENRSDFFESGVAMLHKLPVVLKSTIRFPSLDGSGIGEDEGHILPAFKKLAHLFWIFDQSGAFEALQNSDNEDDFLPNHNEVEAIGDQSLDMLQRKLQEVPLESEQSNDIQRADICVTRQWMQAVLWRVALHNGRASSSHNNTSLSHPIQIAKEFLEFISQLPSTAIEAHGPGMVRYMYKVVKSDVYPD